MAVAADRALELLKHATERLSPGKKQTLSLKESIPASEPMQDPKKSWRGLWFLLPLAAEGALIGTIVLLVGTGHGPWWGVLPPAFIAGPAIFAMGLFHESAVALFVGVFLLYLAYAFVFYRLCARGSARVWRFFGPIAMAHALVTLWRVLMHVAGY